MGCSRRIASSSKHHHPHYPVLSYFGESGIARTCTCILSLHESEAEIYFSLVCVVSVGLSIEM